MYWNLIWGEHTRESCEHGTDIAPRHFRSREQRIIAVRDVKDRLVPNRAIVQRDINIGTGHVDVVIGACTWTWTYAVVLSVINQRYLCM
jgi:hypothetical protein